MKNIYLLFLTVVISACGNSYSSMQNTGGLAENAIAYNIAVKDSAGKTNYEVFIMDTDGKNVRNISNNADVAWTYRAHKDRLYFVSDRDTCYRCLFLYVTEANGKNINQVTTLQLEDSWMDTRNDGKEIIVSGRLGKTIRHQLFIINTQSGMYKQITNDTAATYIDPAFSPDGKQIAFSYRKNKHDKTTNEELYLMNIDGNGMKQLTHYPQENISRQSGGYKAGCTHWHPIENFITYISIQDGRHNIYAVNADGSNQRRLTKNEFSEGWHDWSDDGNWLTFDKSNKEETQYHIMLMNWKTKEIKQLTGTVHKYQQSPVFVQK
jgi:TolB protein